MSKKAKLTKIFACLICCFVTTIAFAIAGCSSLKNDKGPKFLKGILTEITYGDSLILDEYIDYVDEDYSIIVTGPNDYYADITTRATWRPEAPGEYTITYKIEKGEYKGENSFVLTVKVPKIVCTYTPQTKYVELGDELIYEEYYEGFNFQVDSYYDYSFIMDSVMFNGVETLIENQVSYTFTEVGEHRMFFHILTEDGQKKYFDSVVRVRSCDAEMAAWMEENNVSAYNYSRLENGQRVVLGESVYQNRNANDPSGPNVSTYDMSYIAFEGEYSFNDFVIVDFTGNNMPIFSFFNDIIEENVWNKSGLKNRFTKATILANGWTDSYGNPVPNFVNSLNRSFVVYGPYKCEVYYQQVVGVNRHDYLWETKGRSGMADLTTENRINSSYRMIVGVTGGTKHGITIELYLFDRNTSEVISNIKHTTPADFDFGFGSMDYFKGSIALYGQFGKTTTFDKVFEIEEDTTMEAMIEKYAKKSEFSTGKTVYPINTPLNISEFISPNHNGSYQLSYKDSNGLVTVVEGETLEFPKEGEYLLNYSDGENFPVTMKIYAASQQMYDLGASGYKMEIDENNKVVLGAGTHLEEDDINVTKVTAGVDQSYFAFHGNYGVNDFVVVDFTGDNMPYFSFFSGEVKNSMFVDDSSTKELNKRLLIINGFRDKTGANIASYDSNRNAWIRAYGIYGIVHPESGVSVSEGMVNENIVLDYGIKALQDNYANTRFRMIVGFTNATATSVNVEVILIDLDTAQVVASQVRQISFEFPEDYFNGNIILYGTFGKTITLDKVYPIEEDTTIDAVVKKFSSNVKEEFDAWAKENNIIYNNINTSDNRVILNAGISNAPADWGPGRADGVTFDFANVTYNGNYGANDFVVVDFTGNNMPVIEFFKTVANNSFSNDVVYDENASENQGIVLLNGMVNNDNTYDSERASNNNVSLCGPYGIYNVYYLMTYGWHDYQSTNIVVDENYGMVDLATDAYANTHFRMIAGFVPKEEGSNVLNFRFVLINLDTNEVVSDKTLNNITIFEGGIISMYGQLGRALTLDKVYAIEENTTVEALLAKYLPMD